MKHKTFVIGDIHGKYKMLMDVIEKSGIDKQKDRLICLGDVCDRGKKVVECIRELKTFNNLIYILGNHDQWTLDSLSDTLKHSCRMGAYDYRGWLEQGGKNTLESIKKHNAGTEVFEFLKNRRYFFEDEEHRLYVHGGIDPERKVEDLLNEDIMWNRHLVRIAREEMLTPCIVKYYKEVFVGHTPTQSYHCHEPLKMSNVWMMDCGAGHGYHLAMMDVSTKKFWIGKDKK